MCHTRFVFSRFRRRRPPVNPAKPVSDSPIPGWRKWDDGLWYPARPSCAPGACGTPEAAGARGNELRIHTEPQNTDAEAWRHLLDLIDEAAADRRKAFRPRRKAFRPRESMLALGFWHEIVTLPPTIAKLTAVRELDLYGSHLIAIPPQIGEMSALTTFDPYTSHRLHWYPYEITRCAKLRDSRVSTRFLYGNFKNRLPFPRLPATLPAGSLPPSCSVCRGAFGSRGPIQRWISLWVATDVLPLLVHACSEACVNALPAPADGYVDHPHQGGPDLAQPPTEDGYDTNRLREILDPKRRVRS